MPIGTSLAFILAKTLAEYSLELSFYIPASIMLFLATLLAFRAPEEGGGGSFAFIKDSRIVILSFTQFAVFFAMIGTFTWAALYLTTFGASPLKAAGYASIFPLSGVLGAAIGGISAERIGEKKTNSMEPDTGRCILCSPALFSTPCFRQYWFSSLPQSSSGSGWVPHTG